jgi:NAD(P)-dependent dehydrogenase (short-subunit alcohol dehydrogenase family)
MYMQDKVCIISGSTAGMGKAIAKKFAEEGGKVIVSGRRADVAKEVAEEIKSAGGEATGLKMDVRDRDEINKVVESVIKKYGKVDVLVNCAGGTEGAKPGGDSDSLDIDDWDNILNLNLKGVLHTCLAVLPVMKQRRSGKIVNLSSMGAFKTQTSVLHIHSANGAVEALSTNLAFELAPLNIHVNVIVPGPIRTSFWNFMPEEVREGFFAALSAKEVPLLRIGEPEDIAGVALFLGSELSDYVTGQTIYAGGGLGCIYSHEATYMSSSDGPGGKNK